MNPYIFDDSEKYFKKLINILLNMGIEYEKTIQEYDKRTWNLYWKWHQVEITIIFIQSWALNDGMEREDVGISICIGEKMITSIYFDELGKSTDYNGNLKERIISFIIKAIKNYEFIK